ncbi:hypothetical protein N9A86_00505 [Akkermansiaceae bacterium]|nr:hypothetical protein [Akkermansiaceae bacterium]MDB4544503.1 hypothetical protein [Akkermansiaceae bacterium]
MKHSYLLILLTSGFLFGDEPEGSLTFTDRTSVSGRVSYYDPQSQTLEMVSPSLHGNVTLNTRQLLELGLNGNPKAQESDHYAIATINHHFNNSHQDTIRGRLVNLDDDSITLDTWYAGPLTLRRSMVTALDVYPQSPSFYDGPNGLEGWVSSDGDLEDSWKYVDRALISKSSAGIAREVDLPERSMISCRVSWKNSPYFYIMFLSDTPDTTYLRQGYSLYVQTNSLQLTRAGSNNARSSLFRESIRSLMSKESATFKIYLDRRKEGVSAIYLDNKQVGTWTGQDDTEVMGKWLHFIPRNSQPIKVSDISISQWDGVLPAGNDEKDKSATDELFQDMKGQTIHLANGDIIKGTIDKIEDGEIFLKTTFGDIEMPVNRMSSVSLGDSESKEEPRRSRTRGGDIRAWFSEGGFITFDLLSFDGKTLHGKSQVFKEAKFDADAFSKIEFNIWESDWNRFGEDEDW